MIEISKAQLNAFNMLISTAKVTMATHPLPVNSLPGLATAIDEIEQFLFDCEVDQYDWEESERMADALLNFYVRKDEVQNTSLINKITNYLKGLTQ